jgi:solute carrier family 25 aspartate/glutamate transporter 12/13
MLALSASPAASAVAHSKDGKIDVHDLLNHSAAESRYTNISPLEANLVWHFASRGRGPQTRLDLDDFRALLDEQVSSSGPRIP